MCSCGAAHTLDTHRIMHACLALLLALATPALAAPAPARLGYEREIDAARINLLHRRPQPYVLDEDFVASHKNRAKLITRPLPVDNIAEDNALVESNVLSIVTPEKRNLDKQVSDALVRQRRGYNLENVRVPARYPYLPVPNYNRFRRWG